MVRGRGVVDAASAGRAVAGSPGPMARISTRTSLGAVVPTSSLSSCAETFSTVKVRIVGTPAIRLPKSRTACDDGIQMR